MKHVYKLLLAAILLGSCQTDGSQTDLNIDRNPDELFLNTTPHKKMIVDVDMCTDVDDACALRVATALDDDGIIDLQGVAFSVNGPNNLDALRGFLLYEGKPDVLIGKSAVANPPEESPYWDLMAEYSDGKVNAYEAVKMYRKILVESDTPVDIVTTGYTTNIEYLLKSEPDEYSDLTGLELVKRKCGQLYVVGATYPEGRCNNIWFAPAARTAADYISKANYLILEANYDEEMLKMGPYPQYLKERIMSRTGHMSNSATAEFLAENITEHLRYIWLCHLSKDNNHPELAYKTVEWKLKNKGVIVGKDVQLLALKRNTPSELYVFE